MWWRFELGDVDKKLVPNWNANWVSRATNVSAGTVRLCRSWSLISRWLRHAARYPHRSILQVRSPVLGMKKVFALLWSLPWPSSTAQRPRHCLKDFGQFQWSAVGYKENQWVELTLRLPNRVVPLFAINVEVTEESSSQSTSNLSVNLVRTNRIECRLDDWCPCCFNLTNYYTQSTGIICSLPVRL